MIAFRTRRTAGLVLIAASVIAFVWSLWPHPTEIRRVEVSAIEFEPLGALTKTVENGMLVLKWPAVVNTGERETIQLDLTSPPPVTAAETGAEDSLEAGYHRLVEARLELAGAGFDPPGMISQAMVPGRTLRFSWNLMLVRPGSYDGTVWLHMRFLPADGAEDSVAEKASLNEQPRLLNAQRIHLEARSFLGANGRFLRWIAGVGILVGFVFSLEGLTDFLRQKWNIPC